MTAKARYKEAAKARGLDNKDPSGIRRSAEAKIQLAKSKSHCSACGQRGHWHKDPVCGQWWVCRRPEDPDDPRHQRGV